MLKWQLFTYLWTSLILPPINLRDFAWMVSGGSLFFTFAGILIGLPVFSLIIKKSVSYQLGFAIRAVSTFSCGIALLLSHQSGRLNHVILTLR